VHDSLELDRTECESLIRSGVVGRIAVSTPTGPHIIPVNYSIVDDAIIVRTSPYSLLGTYGRDTTLAFEVDQFDHEYHSGWSVVARGRGEFVTDAEQLDHIRAVWQPHPWVTGAREMHLRLRWEELSGRRLGAHGDLLRALPVRRVP
jgi:nitroimidazol reductase NimA-like FMN-containing flavoprotein (pyridoxamine 5'-phosphate oxidase superfamily)